MYQNLAKIIIDFNNFTNFAAAEITAQCIITN
jgi:hypothetical protein